MSTCQHLHNKTGEEKTLICQNCGAVFTPDPAVVNVLRQGRKRPLAKKDIRYWYQVPARVTFHYRSDGQESCIDTVLDIPMTEPFISDLQEATSERSTTQKAVLEESLDALLEDVAADLREKLPPNLQQDCTITATITGPISYSKAPLS